MNQKKEVITLDIKKVLEQLTIDSSNILLMLNGDSQSSDSEERSVLLAEQK